VAVPFHHAGHLASEEDRMHALVLAGKSPARQAREESRSSRRAAERWAREPKLPQAVGGQEPRSPSRAAGLALSLDISRRNPGSSTPATLGEGEN
jgi:hypothetical protein